MKPLHASSGVNVFRRRPVAAARVEPMVRPLTARLPQALIVGGLMLSTWGAAHASDADDRKILAALDSRYQKAVKENDSKTMADILADDFVLVEGDGKRSSKADLLSSATSGKTHYEHQEDTDRTIVVSGNTAVVTAKLWAKGIEDGAKVDYVLWFSDVYVRTPKGWRYFFAQASLPVRSNSEH
jgi:ketosteroid isomerase-like protein